LGKFLKFLQWKMLVYLWPFGIFCGHLLHFVAICYILWPFSIFCGHFVYCSRFGMLYQEKSCNSGIYTKCNYESHHVAQEGRTLPRDTARRKNRVPYK
jgi:hypothetical protein